MKLTAKQISLITDNIKNFTFSNSGNVESQCKNVALTPDNIIYNDNTEYTLVITCDVGEVKTITCYVNFKPETMEVLGIMDEFQVDRLLVEREGYYQIHN